MKLRFGAVNCDYRSPGSTINFREVVIELLYEVCNFLRVPFVHYR